MEGRAFMWIIFRGNLQIRKAASTTGVIAVSESMTKRVHDLYQVPSEKIRMIPNGIDVRQYQPRPNPTLLPSYGISPENPFLIFVGRITRQKGIIHWASILRNPESRNNFLKIWRGRSTICYHHRKK